MECNKFRNPSPPDVRKLDGDWYSRPAVGKLDGDWHSRIGETIGKYKIVSKLGKGGNGIVYEVTDNESKNSYAMKISIKDFCGKYGRQMAKEIEVLKKIEYCDYKNKAPILKLKDYFEHDGKLYLIFPLMGETIEKVLYNSNFGYFERYQIQQIGYQIFQALSFMHYNGIIHTDLKNDNIMFTSSKTDYKYDNNAGGFITHKTNNEIRIIDVGLARFDNEDRNVEISNDYCQAPEILLDYGYGTRSDIWAVGVVLFEMWSGKVLFDYESRKTRLMIMEKVLGPAPVEFAKHNETFYRNGYLDVNPFLQQDINSQFSPLEMYKGLDGYQDEEFISLMRCIWEWDPVYRPIAATLMRHSFFKGMGDIYGYE